MPVKPFSSEHLDAVLHIENEVKQHPWTMQQFQDCLNSKTYECMGYFDNSEKLLGFIIIMYAADEIELLNICVANSEQNRGIGKKLLNYFLTRNFSKAFLEVRESNHNALAFYKNNGFRQIAIRKKYYKNPEENALILVHKNPQ